MCKSGILLRPNFLWSDLAVRLRCTRCRRTVIDRDVEGSGAQDARQTSARHAARRSERLCGSIGGTRKDSGSVIYSTAPFTRIATSPQSLAIPITWLFERITFVSGEHQT